MKWNWTDHDDAILCDGVEAGLNLLDVAAKIGCARHHAYWRCKTLGLERRDLRVSRDPAAVEAEAATPDWSQQELQDMNLAFCEAMHAAHPELPIGVCTKPSTDYARMRQAYTLPLGQSVAAECAAMSLY